MPTPLTTSARYLDPFTDYGFKRLFGEEDQKEFLRRFLNGLFAELGIPETIDSLSFEPQENLPKIRHDRSAIYDIYCTTSEGQHIIVEMQKAMQKYFRDRSIFYATFPIQRQARKGRDWNFELKAVYCIGILDFILPVEEDESERCYVDENPYSGLVHHVQLKDQKNQVFYKKLHYLYLEMPRFDKQASELETELDRFLYLIRYLVELEDIPASLSSDQLFLDTFHKAELSLFDSDELDAYERNLKIHRDQVNTVVAAREEGIEQGKEEEQKELVQNLMDRQGISEEDAREMLGLFGQRKK